MSNGLAEVRGRDQPTIRRKKSAEKGVVVYEKNQKHGVSAETFNRRDLSLTGWWINSGPINFGESISLQPSGIPKLIPV